MPREMFAGYFAGGKYRTEKIPHPTTGKLIYVRISEAIKNVRKWADMDHWDYYVKVNYEGRSLSLPYSTGLGWEKNSLDGRTVLGSLISDYIVEDGYSVQDFADDMGCELPEARKVYAALLIQSEAMRRVFEGDLPTLIDSWGER